jgi:hypothetical protein
MYFRIIASSLPDRRQPTNTAQDSAVFGIGFANYGQLCTVFSLIQLVSRHL